MSHIATLIGTGGTDTVTLLTSGAISVSGIDTVIGNAGTTDTVTLLTDGNITVRGIASVIGTGTGSRHRDPAVDQRRSACRPSTPCSAAPARTDTVTLLTSGSHQRLRHRHGASAQRHRRHRHPADRRRISVSNIASLIGGTGTTDTVTLLTSGSVSVSASPP